eukprot:1842869-Rhodomonas_salina.2
MQIPKVKAGVSSQLQQRALKVMFEFMNQPRWGGLIANLTHRALGRTKPYALAVRCVVLTRAMVVRELCGTDGGNGGLWCYETGLWWRLSGTDGGCAGTRRCGSDEGLVRGGAVLTGAMVALWYLHSNHALRENFVSTVDQCMRENQVPAPYLPPMPDYFLRTSRLCPSRSPLLPSYALPTADVSPYQPATPACTGLAWYATVLTSRVMHSLAWHIVLCRALYSPTSLLYPVLY